jgi:tetraacyldisaccharide 4'-kinase
VEHLWDAIVRGERRGLLARLARLGLRVASWPYGLGVWSRNAGFTRGWTRIHRVAAPVVSIGNLTLGGTGKTPCVEYVARFYCELGIRAAILSRGYGGDIQGNDEAMVLAANLPEVVQLHGSDRVELAKTAVAKHKAEVLLLDDGFQHRRLHRDLDVVLIDATRPPARDHLFPRGTLREPVESLRRADAIVLTRCDQASRRELDALRVWLSRYIPGKDVTTSEHRPIELVGGKEPEPVEKLRERPVAGFCGIGNPAAFRRTLEILGAKVIDFREYPDHHSYPREDVDDLTRWAEQLPADAVIATTQKDLVKLRLASLAGRPLRAVRIGLAFRDGHEEFDAALRRLVIGAAS